MFQDEARFGRINDVRRCWAPKPMRPLCQAMLTHEYTYAYAVVQHSFCSFPNRRNMTLQKVFLNSVLDIFIFGPCQAAGAPPGD